MKNSLMNRFLYRLFFIAVISLILAGCGSSRKSVRSGGSGKITSNSGGVHRGGESTPSDGGSAYLAQLLQGISDPMARDLISEAGGWIGTRYVYGGESRDGTDCSGLVMSVYRDVCGVKIPRTTRRQVRYCTQVARNKLRPGDLIFFGKGESPDSVSHVGMFVGEGRMIHASSSRGVIVSSFDTGYWADRYCTGGRVEDAPRSYASLGKSPKSPPLPPPILTVEERIDSAAFPPATVAVSPAPTPPVVVDATPIQPLSIDFLDQIISNKIDSIASAIDSPFN